MPTFEWICHECKVFWEKEYSIGKAPARTKCPECKKLSEQFWAGRDIPVHFKGAGWTGKNSATGYNKKGGSDEINQMLQEKTKKRMESGWQQYASYTPPQEVYDRARKLSDKEVKQKVEAAKEISDHVYNKANINPHNKYKPQ